MGSIVTPPPPLAVEDVFSEFAGQSKTTVRLHPRRAYPGVRESSLGGLLLWPAEEAWPECAAGDDHDEPIVLVAVLQIFARDVPELPFPNGTDVFQLLWCPALHDEDCRPRPVVRWRAEASIGELLDNPEPPDDEDVEDNHVPNICGLSPERVRELPYPWELDADLRDRVEAWAKERGWSYFAHLSAASGTKVGGWPQWIQDPEYPVCHCGTTMTHLITVASGEWDGESWRRWSPEGTVDGGEAAGLCLGDGGSNYFFTCPRCPNDPPVMVFQCS
ncbi:hypothetical protein [Actinoplanes sp. NPDC051859]|uniref:hypothetical protein n=1 Tax=Actinoplanes sp. NPDC051859 TaxID=3363909 RepID=UPI0037BC5C02